jgi:hypothetical protein
MKEAAKKRMILTLSGKFIKLQPLYPEQSFNGRPRQKCFSEKPEQNPSGRRPIFEHLTVWIHHFTTESCKIDREGSRLIERELPAVCNKVGIS